MSVPTSSQLALVDAAGAHPEPIAVLPRAGIAVATGRRSRTAASRAAGPPGTAARRSARGRAAGRARRAAGRRDVMPPVCSSPFHSSRGRSGTNSFSMTSRDSASGTSRSTTESKKAPSSPSCVEAMEALLHGDEVRFGPGRVADHGDEDVRERADEERIARLQHVVRPLVQLGQADHEDVLRPAAEAAGRIGRDRVEDDSNVRIERDCVAPMRPMDRVPPRLEALGDAVQEPRHHAGVASRRWPRRRARRAASCRRRPAARRGDG